MDGHSKQIVRSEPINEKQFSSLCGGFFTFRKWNASAPLLTSEISFKYNPYTTDLGIEESLIIIGLSLSTHNLKSSESYIE